MPEYQRVDDWSRNSHSERPFCSSKYEGRKLSLDLYVWRCNELRSLVGRRLRFRLGDGHVDAIVVVEQVRACLKQTQHEKVSHQVDRAFVEFRKLAISIIGIREPSNICSLRRRVKIDFAVQPCGENVPESRLHGLNAKDIFLEGCSRRIRSPQSHMQLGNP